MKVAEQLLSLQSQLRRDSRLVGGPPPVEDRTALALAPALTAEVSGGCSGCRRDHRSGRGGGGALLVLREVRALREEGHEEQDALLVRLGRQGRVGGHQEVDDSSEVGLESLASLLHDLVGLVAHGLLGGEVVSGNLAVGFFQLPKRKKRKKQKQI